MKIRWKVYLILLLNVGVLVLINGCNKQTNNKKDHSNTISSVVNDSTINDQKNNTLTKEQMYEDYDYMWNIIEENYPFMNVAERITGENFEELKDWYRKKIERAENVQNFYYILQTCLSRFEGCGHLTVVDKNVYNTLMVMLPDSSDYLYNIINNDKSKKFYHYTGSDHIKSTIQNNETYTCISKTKKFKKDKVGYISIKSFDGLLIDKDYKVIMNYLKSITSYKDLIIDIRGNPGGSMGYWMKNLVMPNLEHDISYKLYSFVKGDLAKEYKSITTQLYNIDDFKASDFVNLNLNDIKEFDWFIESTNQLDIQGDEPLFKGDIYLLVDKEVYSSSDAFAYFCKQTKWATVIGENTDGDGVGGSPLVISLPNSGICFRFSAGYGINSDGSNNEEYGTTPDVLCKGENALEVCLDLIADKKK